MLSKSLMHFSSRHLLEKDTKQMIFFFLYKNEGAIGNGEDFESGFKNI